MADNTTLNTGTGGDVISTDDLATINGGSGTGQKVQRVKVGYGSDGDFRDVDTTHGIPIQGTQTAVSTVAWTSATTVNTANSISIVGMNTVTVAMSNTSTMTGGVLTFEVSPDGTNWFPVSLARIDSYTVETTYTLSTVANRAWSTSVDGFTNFRVRLSTVITGSGTANVFVTAQTLAIEPIVSVGQANAANLNATVDTELPAAATLADATALASSPSVAAIAYLFNGTFHDRARTVIASANTTGLGVMAAGLAAQLDDVSTGTVTENNFANLRMSTLRGLHVTLHPDAVSSQTTSRVKSAASTNATSLKASAGVVTGYRFSNNTASAKYVKFYNKASAPTVGTDTPLWTEIIPANSGVTASHVDGIPFTTGIAYAITGAITDADTTATAADDVHGFIKWV